jgi:signal peptidase I
LGIWAVSTAMMAIVSVVLILVVRMYFIEPFSISGTSMTPTYNNNDYVLIAKWPMQYQRGDVVVAEDPQDTSVFLVKRIVGLPNEAVTIADGKLDINGVSLNEPYLDITPNSTSSVILGSDQYFLLGDNPATSFDSRAFGGVNKEYIRGKVIYKIGANSLPVMIFL